MISLFDPGFIHSTGCAENQSPYLGFRSELLGRMSLPCWLQKQAARQQRAGTKSFSFPAPELADSSSVSHASKGHPEVPTCGPKQGSVWQQSKSCLGPFQSLLSAEYTVKTHGPLHCESAVTFNTPRAMHTHLSYKQLHRPGRLTF